MRNIIDSIKRVFCEKEEVLVIELDDLRAYLSDTNLFCNDCKKQLHSLEEISRVTVKNKQIQLYCKSCKVE
jgi:hypothetical protein